MLLKLEKGFDKFANIIGIITAIIMVLMILNVFYDVIARYSYSTFEEYFNFHLPVSIAFQEMEWHLFSVIILLGISYTLKEDGHVRVDLIYDTLTYRKKAIINMIGVVLFILPISLLIGTASLDYVYEAYISNEQSGDPGGLTHRWIVKALIPTSFFLLIITSIGFFIRNVNIFNGLHPENHSSIEEELEEMLEDAHKAEKKLHKGENK